MNKTRLIQLAATLLALYGGAGAFMTDSGSQWTLFLFPLGGILLATGGALPRAVASAFTFSLAALCAMIAWRAGQRGTAEWFLSRFESLTLLWLGLSALLAAPLFERPALAVEEEPETEPDAELQAEPA